jgi:hypothetical protein
LECPRQLLVGEPTGLGILELADGDLTLRDCVSGSRVPAGAADISDRDWLA